MIVRWITRLRARSREMKGARVRLEEEAKGGEIVVAVGGQD